MAESGRLPVMMSFESDGSSPATQVARYVGQRLRIYAVLLGEDDRASFSMQVTGADMRAMASKLDGAQELELQKQKRLVEEYEHGVGALSKQRDRAMRGYRVSQCALALSTVAHIAFLADALGWI